MAPESDGSLVVTVEIEALAQAYGLRLNEAWPASWSVEPHDDGGAVRKGNEWLWPRLIEPGEALVVRYRARPLTPTEGEIEVKGLISSALPRFSYLVGGQQEAHPRASPPQIRGVRITRSGEGLGFRVEGQGIATFRLQLFNLAGGRIYDSGWVENGLILSGQSKVPWANGVYLYALTVRGPAGEELRRLGKVVVLR
jgi:hypothetical protein